MTPSLQTKRIMVVASGGLTVFTAFVETIDVDLHGLTFGRFQGQHGVPFAVPLLLGIAVICGLWFTLPKAWEAARRLRPNIHLVVVVLVLGAAGWGAWFVAATASFVVASFSLVQKAGPRRAESESRRT